jgi:hypothetical protein
MSVGRREIFFPKSEIKSSAIIAFFLEKQKRQRSVLNGPHVFDKKFPGTSAVFLGDSPLDKKIRQRSFWTVREKLFHE